MILITGCARSGTSLTTEVLRTCGANTGKTNSLNEHVFVRDQIVKPYIRELGFDPLCQEPLITPADVTLPSDWASRVTEALGEGANCYKGAKMCHMWPVWHNAFPDAKWVIVRRDREKIIDSCLRTKFMKAYSDREGWGHWHDQHLERFAEMREVVDYIEFYPDSFSDGDISVIDPLADHCGLEAPSDDSVLDIFNPGRWHG